jgi:hypothetical protein
MLEGSLEAKILFVSDFLRVNENAERVIFDENKRSIIVNAMNRAGIVASDYAFTVIHDSAPKNYDFNKFNLLERMEAQAKCKDIINSPISVSFICF